MTTRTAMASALIKAGMHPADYELGAAIQKYQRARPDMGERAVEMVRDIFGLPGEGRQWFAGDSPTPCAPSRQAVEDVAAHGPSASNGHSSIARPSSSNRGGEGHRTDAQSSQDGRALPVRDANTKRGITSITSIQPTIKQGLIELKKTASGQPWGSVGWHELDGMDRDGTIARIIKREVNPPRTQTAQLRTFITNKQFEGIVNAAEKQNDFI